MRKDVDFYNLMMEASGAAWQAAPKVAEALAADQLPPLLSVRRGRAESPAWFLVQAVEFDPEPISVEKLRVRDVYGAPRMVSALLVLLATEGWLEPVREGEYQLTAAGREMVERLRERSRRMLAEAEGRAIIDLERLEQLLGRLINASLESGNPPGSWCLRHSRRRAPEREASPLLKIQHYFADFNAFRDDAHMAAWLRHGLSGAAWEALSLIWQEEANTAAGITELLHYRGYFLQEYEEALQSLVERGWLENEGGQYTLTQKGRAIREAAERLTNAYFYAPWSTLSETEIEELERLLVALRDRGFETGALAV